MTQIRWSLAAADDLEAIATYLQEKTPTHAERLVREIVARVESLASFPLSGRIGLKPGTRELVTAPLPWVIVYTASFETVSIVRILHGSQLRN